MSIPSLAPEIRSDDLLIVDRSPEPRHGRLVVAGVDGEMLVKHLHVEPDGSRFLVDDDPDPAPVELSVRAAVTVWGGHARRPADVKTAETERHRGLTSAMSSASEWLWS